MNLPQREPCVETTSSQSTFSMEEEDKDKRKGDALEDGRQVERRRVEDARSDVTSLQFELVHECQLRLVVGRSITKRLSMSKSSPWSVS